MEAHGTAVALEGVALQYPGGFTAIDEITFEVPRGQFVTVVGPTTRGTAQALARVAVKTLRYIHSHSAADIAGHLPAQVFYPDGNRDAFAKVLDGNLGMFSTDGKMPPDGPPDVLKTLQAADPSTDWTTVDLKKTYDNSFVSAVK